MNEREVSELRRRFRPDKTNITKLCICLINVEHIVSIQSPEMEW